MRKQCPSHNPLLAGLLHHKYIYPSRERIMNTTVISCLSAAICIIWLYDLSTTYICLRYVNTCPCCISLGRSWSAALRPTITTAQDKRTQQSGTNEHNSPEQTDTTVRNKRTQQSDTKRHNSPEQTDTTVRDKRTQKPETNGHHSPNKRTQPQPKGEMATVV